ncbi:MULTISPECIES: type II toxin-antitoxin system ParD family antitoxin [unclassified Rhizobium]|uniref:type II toxin-antitoxin system ParD family antitoxin n=1 Tax=unclassified Rhizobium TaxID=2613769 RepID=UPI0007151514|nr:MULTISPECIES: type II toxin-antitoxin system ParD family antitoxin [unclassified Rhizobium]KQS87681.1 antitoxin [Rhizobium sp. Leaf391]KQT07117.1 antitoxin [Rhizobium sp. Leaf386]KQT95243.1 antitoxin [Rhizobium sp. Leaf453]
MAKSAQITLNDELGDFVDRQVRDGNYASANDVVEAGLRLLREDDAKLEVLKAALIEGEESGEPIEFDFDSFLQHMRAKHAPT